MYIIFFIDIEYFVRQWNSYVDINIACAILLLIKSLLFEYCVNSIQLLQPSLVPVVIADVAGPFHLGRPLMSLLNPRSAK